MTTMNTRTAPRPTTGGASSPADREARLAALAARRSPAPAPRSSDRDALDARLAALSARRAPETRATGRTTPAGTRPAGRTLTGRTKKRHAAKGARAASLGLSLASTGALATLFAMANAGAGSQVQAATIVAGPAAGTSAAAAAAPATSNTSATPGTVNVTIPPADAATDAPQSTWPNSAPASDAPQSTWPSSAPATEAPAATPTPTAAPAAATQTVVQGGVFHNKWGDVQVQATFGADGSLADVQTLQTPSRDGKSVRINQRAVPVLNSEALSVQSASVDTVSGATYTSNDYRRSLQSAIDAAHQAGLTSIA